MNPSHWSMVVMRLIPLNGTLRQRHSSSREIPRDDLIFSAVRKVSCNAYRGEVSIRKSATGARNYTQCDSMLVGDKSAAHTFPYITVANANSTIMEITVGIPSSVSAKPNTEIKFSRTSRAAAW